MHRTRRPIALAIFVAVLTCATSAKSVPGVSFNTPRDFAVGASPISIVVADFNGDGKLDIATANQRGGNVSILLGKGDGQFADAKTASLGKSFYSTAMASGDFNGDGKPDLVVVDVNGGVQVLEGRGDGTFQKRFDTLLQDENRSMALAVADFNNDGILDLAITLPRTDQIAMLFGIGNGTFHAPTFLMVGATPVGLVAGDFNGDGNIDLAEANQGSNLIGILLGNGNGTFTVPTKYSTGGTLTPTLTVSDFNNDGKPDIGVVNYLFASVTLAVLLGNGDGTFQPAQLSTTIFLNGRTTLVVGDFNQDGILDVVLPGGVEQNDQFPVVGSLFLGVGDGTFQFPVSVPISLGAYALGAGDFNGDGTLDLAAALDGNVVQVRLNLGAATFRTPPILLPRRSTSINACMDFNGDGKPDILSTTYSPTGITVSLANGDGTFQSPKFSPSVGAAAIVVADFNNDGTLDVATGDGGAISILLGNGDGTFQKPINEYDSVGAYSIAAGDFNRDGNLDLVTEGIDGVAMFLGHGDGTFMKPTKLYSTFNLYTDAIVVADFNNDGNPDTAFAVGGVPIYVLLGNGDGTFQPSIQVNLSFFPAELIASDINGDGKPDLLVGEQTSVSQHSGGNGSVAILLGKGDGTFQTPIVVRTPNSSVSLAVADLNSDGKPDLAIASPYSSDISVFLGSGDGHFRAAGNFATNGAYTISACDTNSDGKIDLVTSGYATTILTNTSP
jgi:FG-GAP-like repeat/FG-GAP repeat